MKVLVTGATGYVGIPVCRKLADEGSVVNALFRSDEKAKVFDGEENIMLCQGDILDQSSLKKAMEGCAQVFHLAAHARMWDKDPSKYISVNVEGTRNVLSIAAQAGVSRVVFTSTAGVMGPVKTKEKLVNEGTNKKGSLISAYDRSKKQAEEIALKFSNRLDVVIVNPSRIYGPGVKGESNSISKLIELFAHGKWRFIPGDGSSIGNYVYIDDVVQGHLLAMEKGKCGERYILGGNNLSYNELFLQLQSMTGQMRKLHKIPVSVLRKYSQWEMLLARMFGKKPLIVPEFVEKLTLDWSLSSRKAEEELGYSPIDIKTGLKNTLQWLGYE